MTTPGSAAGGIACVDASSGLVPCGGSSQCPCTLCHFITGISNIIKIIRDIMVFIGLAVITAMGIVYVVSAGDEKMITLAKNGIKTTLMGIVIVLFAWFIVNLVMFYIFNAKNDLGVGVTFKGVNGFVFECSTKSTAGTTAAGTYVAPGNGATTAANGGGAATTCTTGKCATDTSIVGAINGNTFGVPGNILLSIIAGGEGCNKSVSSDGKGSCGYGQLLPANRTKCGITGTPTETCTKIQNDITLDMNCTAWLINDNSKHNCTITDIRKVACCWNRGVPDDCAHTTNDYCGRVERYLNSCK
ncbi:MAG: pilin [Candidatus Moraniibacteriota bacterium]